MQAASPRNSMRKALTEAGTLIGLDYEFGLIYLSMSPPPLGGSR